MILNIIEKLFRLPRWLLMTLALCFLFGGGYYSWLQATENYDNRLKGLNHPGQKICVGFTKIIALTQDEIVTADRLGNKYRLISENKNVRLGQVYSFSGVVTAAGRIDVHTFQHHPFRTLKHIISFSSILFILFFIYKYIRYDIYNSSLIIRDMNEK